ncbi:MAG: HNH endonuclease signature motif containing protein, partial [Pseudonocardiaceae bacterium]
QLTTGQLIEQIKKMAIAIDPAWAQRRYEQAVAERKIVGYRNPDGSANLSGLNLPLERVAAACGHIDALARSAKHAGDSRPIDHIRADLFLGMTDGTYAGLDDATILERLRTNSRSDDPRDDEPGHGEACDGGGDDARVASEGERAATGAPSPHPAPSGAGMELRAQLTTLIGQDEHPGELAGWGPIHAGLTRDLAGLMSRGQWRFVITDHDGHLLHAGFTPARPIGSARRSASSREIVELQIPATTLRELASDPDVVGRWAPVIADLARHHASAQLNPNGDHTRRSPGSVLRRYLQIRDRYCIMIGCRAPARSTDADHTLDHARGGTTTDRNLGHGCRHDHRLKHDGGWRLEQLEPGHFRWISRLGHAYLVHPPPIIDPLPHPTVRSEPALPLVTPPDHELAIWEEGPLEGDAGPPQEPAPPFGPHHDPPPF